MLKGTCHCGNVSLQFDGPTPLGELALRACQCSFCRKHAVRTTSDPRARLSITVRDASDLGRYTFGLHAADFLLCRRCGVYVGALLGEAPHMVATLNVNVLDDDPFGGRTPQPAHYDGEDAEARRKRRMQMWTPTKVFCQR